MENYDKTLAEKYLAEGKAVLKEKPTYKGKLYVAHVWEMYKLLKNVKSHDEALKEAIELTDTAVSIKKCNAYGVEGRFGGAKVKHPVFDKLHKKFDALCEEMSEELKRFKEETGYYPQFYPKIVNAAKNKEWKAAQKS